MQEDHWNERKASRTVQAFERHARRSERFVRTHSKDFFQTFGHLHLMILVFLLQSDVFQCTDEERIDSHGVHGEEARGNHIRSNDNQEERHEVIVQFRNVVLCPCDSTSEEEERQNTNRTGNAELAEKDKKVTDFVNDEHTKWIRHDQVKSSPGRGEKSCSMNSADDVGISIEELQKLLQAEQTATAATE